MMEINRINGHRIAPNSPNTTPTNQPTKQAMDGGTFAVSANVLRVGWSPLETHGGANRLGLPRSPGATRLFSSLARSSALLRF